jgi:ribulose-5-phosphate 4-epimerase/fuculose-1-phosphate aldolase
MSSHESEKRQAIIDACRRMSTLGINQRTSSNISVRHGEGLVTTPTSLSCHAPTAEQIVFMDMNGAFIQGRRPSRRLRVNGMAACRSVSRRCCRSRRAEASAARWPAMGTQMLQSAE